MTDVLYSIDVAIFRFLNGSLGTPVGDALWPLITDYDKQLPVRVALVAAWLWLMVRGGIRGRTVGILLIIVIACADALSSRIIKELVARPRPCHEVDGAVVVDGIRLLVGCGSGKSFPSSHAVNNIAVATLFSVFYEKWWWAFFSGAALVAVSRIFVGVHYPSDVLGGALVGACVCLLIILLYRSLQARWFPSLRVPLFPFDPR